MELVLTGPDPCNADYLDPLTMTLLYRVTNMSKKKSSLSAETTVVQAFRSAAQQQQAVPVQHQQPVNDYPQHTHSRMHGGYGPSPYSTPLAVAY